VYMLAQVLAAKRRWLKDGDVTTTVICEKESMKRAEEVCEA